MDRFKRFRTALGASGQYQQWVRNFRQYHNGPGDTDADAGWSDAFELDGDNSEVLSIRINEMRNLITHILNLTYSKPVGLRAIAANGDPESLEASEVADALLEEDFRSAGGTQLMRRAGEAALVVSTSFIVADWNFDGGDEHVPDDASMVMSGEPTMEDLWIDEVCFDLTKRDWRKVQDVILLRKRDRFELIGRYAPLPQSPGEDEFGETLPATEDDPEAVLLRDKIMTAAPVNKSPFASVGCSSEDDSDDVYTLEYIRKGGTANFMPEGRKAICLEDGTLLDDGPNPMAGFKKLNVFPVTASQGLGTVHGYASASDISPINRMINLLGTIIATNAAAWGSPNLTGPKLEMQDVRNLVGGGRYFGVSPQTGEVKALDLMPDLDKIAKLITLFSSFGEKMSGVANVMRGEGTGEMSGKAIALVKSMAVQFMSSFQQSVVEQHEQIANCLIWMRKNFSNGAQKIAKLGDGKTQQVMDYDATKLGRVARVRAEPIDPVLSTPEGREARADKLLEMGQFTAPWEYTTLVRTGRDDALFKGPMSRNLLIQRENGELLKGLEPIVLKQDAHEMHEAEHLCLLDDPGVRSNERLVQVVLEHNAKHTLFRMGLNVLQGNDPDTGQPYPSAIVQLEQARLMAAQNQQAQQVVQAQQGAQAGPEPAQAPASAPAQPGQRQMTARESLQDGAMDPKV